MRHWRQMAATHNIMRQIGLRRYEDCRSVIHAATAPGRVTPEDVTHIQGGEGRGRHEQAAYAGDTALPQHCHIQ
jgi:hypothetical protein